jgi:D-sedoheptulose 7-phosphate isomerase
MRLADAIKKANRVYLCGNGGSAANAIHIANDLVGCGIKAHALTGDVATLTAIANDFSYQAIFSNQLMKFGEPGDLLIAMSGSGNSENICLAIEAAKARGMYSILITGAYNGEPRAAVFADEVIRVGGDMQSAEEMQLWMGHEAMRQLRK